MAKTITLVDRVRELLAGTRGLEEKKMFGSIGFMVRGHMCVSARAERIMCRIDPDMHDELIKRPGCTTVVMKKRAYRGYVYVDAEVLATKRELKKWVGMALEFNRQLKAK